ncbi:MAG: sigma-54-dependent Fis family transcriptional regulator [Ignavibacteriae bacterium]|nr:sigma-54-dependent Fis family transcriptional regulator [Ignavibacteriota bacterium]
MTPAVPVAIVDDDQEMLRVLERYLQRHGIAVDTFSDPRTALTHFGETVYGVVITDVQMPGMSGLELFGHIRQQMPEAVVIMITGFGSVTAAVQAMKEGAFDYISKPFNYDEFLVVLQKAVRQHLLQREVEVLRERVQRRYSFGNIIGHSDAMRQVFDVIGRVAHTRTNVLVTGESGTGKELIARAIHHGGARKDAPFVAINCGALPETLLESELFGHEKGAYTGAVTREAGLLASADSGTIFLDEVADMPMHMQAKFLRVLEDWEVRPVGGNATRKIDVRVISSSKTDLGDIVAHGDFREDLFYRLNVVTIDIPPLRERMEDVPMLIDHALVRLAADQGRETPVIERDALEALLRHTWPGNVRELEHVLERALILARGPRMTLDDLPPYVREHGGTAARRAGEACPVDTTLEDMERQHILRVLAHVEWKRSLAAEILGINRRTLYRKIQQYRIEEP